MAGKDYMKIDLKNKYSRRPKSRSYTTRQKIDELSTGYRNNSENNNIDIDALMEAPMTYRELEDYSIEQESNEIKIAVNELRKNIENVNDLTTEFQKLRSDSNETEITFNRILTNIEKYHLQASKLEVAIENLHIEIENKGNLIKSLVDDENNLERIIAEYKLTKEECINELHQREIETREAFGDLKDSQIAVQILKDEIEKYTSILKKEEFRYSQVHSHLHEHLEAKDKAEAKINTLRSQIQEKQTLTKKDNDEVIKLHQNANELKKEFSHLKERAEFTTRDLEKTQKEKANILRVVFSQEGEISQLNNDVRKLETRKDKITSDILEAKQTIIQKNMEIENIKRKIETYKNEIIVSSKNNSKATHALEGINAVVREYQQKQKELEAKLQSITEQNQKRKHMVASLIEVKDNTIMAIQKISRQIDVTSNENRTFAVKSGEIDAQIIDLKKNLENKRSQLMVAKRNNDYLTNKLSVTQTDMKNVQATLDKYDEAYAAQTGAAKLKQNKINDYNEKISTISKEINELKRKHDNFDIQDLDKKLVESVLKFENVKLELEQKRSQVLQNFDKVKLKRERISSIETEITKAKMELADIDKKNTQLSRVGLKDTQKLADKESELANTQKDLMYSAAFVEIGNHGSHTNEVDRTLTNILSQGAETQRSISYLRNNIKDYNLLSEFFVNIYKSIDAKESFDCNFKVNTTGSTVNFIVDNLTTFFDLDKTTDAIKTHFKKQWGSEAGIVVRSEEISDGLVSLHVGIDMKQTGLITNNERTV